MTVKQILISQNKTGNIRLIKEEYTVIQKRYVVEHENYFNSHRNFNLALSEYNELCKLELKTKLNREAKILEEKIRIKNEVKKYD